MQNLLLGLAYSFHFISWFIIMVTIVAIVTIGIINFIIIVIGFKVPFTVTFAFIIISWAVIIVVNFEWGIAIIVITAKLAYFAFITIIIKATYSTFKDEEFITTSIFTVEASEIHPLIA